MPGRSDILDGYIRVSQTAGRSGDRFQSPSTQRDVIRSWARANGVRIGKWHEDLDRSGGTMNRPGMNDVLRRIDAGKTGGIVVARLDRFSRSLLGGLSTIQEIQAKGARVVSVSENIDPSTAMGRAFLSLLLVMAELYLGQADEAIESAQLRATSAGRFPGRPAFGYCKTEEGLTQIDREAAEIVVRIFRARASGAGWRSIADDLMRAGVPTPNGRDRWSVSTLTGIVRSKAYIGTFVGPRGIEVQQAWPAIVPLEMWDRANDVRGVRDSERRHTDRLYAGLARCQHCRHVMTRTVNPEGFVSYGCRTLGCKGRSSIGAVLLDEHVSRVVDARLARITLEPRTPDDGGEHARLVARRDKAVRDLERLSTDTELRDEMGYGQWRESLRAFARERDDAEAELAELRAARGITELGEVPDGVTPRLDALPWDVRRQVVEALIHSVWVRRSELRGPAARRHVDQRVLVVWKDDRLRPELPRQTVPHPPPLEW